MDFRVYLILALEIFAVYGLYCFVMLFLLWRDYLAIMNLQRVRDTPTGIHGFAHFIGMCYFFIGIGRDIWCNWTVMTFLFFDLPRWGEWTVTARLERYAFGDKQDWRYEMAWWFELQLLGQYTQTGKHLSPP